MIRFDQYILRALEPDDLENLYQSENETSSYMNHEQFFSRFTLENYIQHAHLSLREAKQFRFAIAQKKHQKTAIGFLDLVDYCPIHHRVELGIWISKTHQKRGIATQAIQAVLPYLKTHFELHQVYAYVENSNAISRHLFSQLGFESCGVLKDWRRIGSAWESVILFQKML
ncbi:MAG: GNAT family N-acetyltransferase [Flavobacteriales bacterium]